MEQEKNQVDASLAWYKLADLIARKEREKALSVYRLLSHSFHDKAYILQLEGDILWSFDDHEAAEKYRQAAFLYRKEQRWINAISVCEHLLQLDPYHEELLATLIDLYLIVDWEERLHERLTMVVVMLEKKQLTYDQGYAVFKILIERAKKAESEGKYRWLCNVLDCYKDRLPELLWARLEKQK